jgi:hypothetical protein
MRPQESLVFLGAEASVPVDRPFTRRQALSQGVTDRRLAAWVAVGLLRHPLRGVFHATQLAETPDLRLACLQLVVPENAVVTGRTAGWLQSAPMILAPGDHLRVPRVEMHLIPGNRLRNALAIGGERTFRSHEVVDFEGLWVTSKLRTTVDLGMGLPRRQAFAAMCAMTKVADFDREELQFEIRERGRFAGYRGVRQIRLLEPHVSPDYESGPECALGLEWLEQAGMPPLTLQHPVSHPHGTYYLDLSVPALKYAAEYNGARWHDAQRSAYDAQRVGWLIHHEGWTIDVFEREDLYGQGAEPGLRLRAGVERARRRYGSMSWTGQTRDGAAWLG